MLARQMAGACRKPKPRGLRLQSISAAVLLRRNIENGLERQPSEFGIRSPLPCRPGQQFEPDFQHVSGEHQCMPLQCSVIFQSVLRAVRPELSTLASERTLSKVQGDSGFPDIPVHDYQVDCRIGMKRVS